MKRLIQILLIAIPVLFFSYYGELRAQNNSTKYIIAKENGRIIKAYFAFGDFLNSDKSWESYKRILFDAYPEMKGIHKTQLSWGTIDSLTFPEEVKKYKKEDWEKYFTEYDDKTLNTLYDTIIAKENLILKPINNNPVDLCLFLPYDGCFIISGSDKNTICISLLIDPRDAEKIMVHEYAHNLHSQRRPTEAFNLGREIVAEGIAVYLTTLTLKEGVNKAIPFMPDSSVKWCFKNEQLIKKAILSELNDSTFDCLKKFISDGSLATPPSGFVEKTGFFAGYRVIEACIKKGLTLEEICSMNSKAVIDKSGYFD